LKKFFIKNNLKIIKKMSLYFTINLNLSLQENGIFLEEENDSDLLNAMNALVELNKSPSPFPSPTPSPLPSLSPLPLPTPSPTLSNVSPIYLSKKRKKKEQIDPDYHVGQDKISKNREAVKKWRIKRNQDIANGTAEIAKLNAENETLLKLLNEEEKQKLKAGSDEISLNVRRRQWRSKSNSDFAKKRNFFLDMNNELEIARFTSKFLAKINK